MKSANARPAIRIEHDTDDNDDLIIKGASDLSTIAKTHGETRKLFLEIVNDRKVVADRAVAPPTYTTENTTSNTTKQSMDDDEHSRRQSPPSDGQQDNTTDNGISPQAVFTQNESTASSLSRIGHSITGKTTDQILQGLEQNIDNAYGGQKIHDDGGPLAADLGGRENRAWEAYSNLVYKETGTQLTRIPLGPPLEMIHHSATTTEWKNNIPFSHSTAFIDHKDPVYKLGGKVSRSGIDGEEQDVMICNFDQCAKCKLGKNAVIVTESKTEGLPFVHVSDFYSTQGIGFHYLPKTKACNDVYPKRMWKTKVTFWDGKERKVVACEGSICAHCSGQDTVAKKAARYNVGGDLYEENKAQGRAAGT